MHVFIIVYNFSLGLFERIIIKQLKYKLFIIFQCTMNRKSVVKMFDVLSSQYIITKRDILEK